MILIAAVDKNWGIGYQNKLLVSIPADMKFFRTTTTGNVVVMGRKTLESFPGQKPLKNRVNIILTRDVDYKVSCTTENQVVIVHDIDSLLEELKKYDEDRVFCIGGESIYKQLEPYCSKAYITKIDYEYQADAFFPNLDENPDWKLVEESDEETYFDVVYNFTTYTR